MRLLTLHTCLSVYEYVSHFTQAPVDDAVRLTLGVRTSARRRDRLPAGRQHGLVRDGLDTFTQKLHVTGFTSTYVPVRGSWGDREMSNTLL